jgi:hypothetical protein
MRSADFWPHAEARIASFLVNRERRIPVGKVEGTLATELGTIMVASLVVTRDSGPKIFMVSAPEDTYDRFQLSTSPGNGLTQRDPVTGLYTAPRIKILFDSRAEAAELSVALSLNTALESRIGQYALQDPQIYMYRI